MKNLFILFLSVIFSLFLCETILRYFLINDQLKLRVEANQKQFKDFQKLTWRPDTLSFIPNSKGFVNHPEYKYTIYHDNFGFRNPCKAKRNEAIKDIVIGDSFVYGVGVQDNATLNCVIKIDNYTLGVPNSSPTCYLKILKRHYPTIKNFFNIKEIINIHIIIYVGNDFESLISLGGSCPSKTINNAKINKSGLLQSINYIITKGMLSEFYLPQVPKILYKNYRNKKKYETINSSMQKFFLDNGNDTFYTSIDHVNQKNLTNSLKILLEEFNKVDQNKLNIKFYLLPSGSDISKERLIRKSKISSFDYKIIDIDVKYLSILKSCKKIKASCVDLRKYFKDENYYFHDTHLNASGIKILSKIIEDEAKKL